MNIILFSLFGISIITIIFICYKLIRINSRLTYIESIINSVKRSEDFKNCVLNKQFKYINKYLISKTYSGQRYAYITKTFTYNDECERLYNNIMDELLSVHAVLITSETYINLSQYDPAEFKIAWKINDNNEIVSDTEKDNFSLIHQKRATTKYL